MRTAAFTVTRLTDSVYKIVEYDDIFSEHPFIYAKVLSGLLVLIDSGCGGASNSSDVDVTKLREFIETWPVEENANEPLNPGGKRKYVVICTHCHYDHILALEQFAPDSLILASSHSPSFLAPENIAKNSLCERLGLVTPKYQPTLVDHDGLVVLDGVVTGLRILHTPGHTPDELAIWDESEKMLYVGDTVYEWEPIIFPPEGDIVEWFASMNALIDFVRRAESLDTSSVHGSVVKINAGHDTSMVDALEVLTQAKSFLSDVVEGREKVKDRKVIRGIETVVYAKRDGRFSLRCPASLVEKARKQLSPSPSDSSVALGSM